MKQQEEKPVNKIRIAVTLAGAALALAGAVACGGGVTPDPTRPPVSTASVVTLHPTTSPTAHTTPPTMTTTTPPPVSLEQKNAARAAQSYLDMQGFSRKGLISQLSSDAGDGFPVKVATAAVDSLHVDWNAQAAKAAKGYLDMQGFSRAGLISQLESSSGDGFTHDQAVYGAHAAGL